MIMNTKELAIRTLEELPEDATWEDVQERINFLIGIRKGLRELDEGRAFRMTASRGVRPMAYRLIWSPSARFDLREISVYIAEADPHSGRQIHPWHF